MIQVLRLDATIHCHDESLTMPFATNITRRRGSANWYFRRAWPKDIQPLVGKRDHWESLGTSDVREARARAAKANWLFEQRINELRRQRSPEEDQVRRVVREFYERELALDYDARIGPDGSGKDHVRHGKLFRPGLAQWLKKHLGQGETVLVEWAADEIIKREGWLIEEGSPRYKDLCIKLGRAWLEALARADERDQLCYSGTPKDEILKVSDDVQGAKKAGKGETIMELFERFAREQKRQSADTLDQSRKIVRRFVEFIGIDADVSAVTPENVREWKFKLYSWPVKANEIRDFRGMDFNQILEANRFLEKPVINERTVAKYLSTLGSFGSWLLAHSYIPRHPTQGLLPEKESRRKGSRTARRRPFSSDELVRLFASPLFTGCVGDRLEHQAGNERIRDDRFWLFPLALFTGARLGELCQLRVADVQEQDDIHFIRITDEGDDMQLKSATSARDVPVHPALLDLGFLEYVERARSSGRERLFTRWMRNARGQYGEASKWLNAYLGRAGVKKDDMVTFHSLRHNFVDALRNAGYYEAQFRPLIGHSEQTVTRGYGQAPDVPLKRRAEMIEAISYPGLDLSHLNASA